LDTEQQRELNQRLRERDMPEIIDWWRQEGIEIGIEQGLRRKALEDARKFHEHGVSWEIITAATGIKPEEIEG
jgi:hypothetical protein